jgi:hypothetical protein
MQKAKMSKKRIVIFSFIHLGALIAFFIVSYSAGMDKIDAKGEITIFQKLSQIITVILMSPMYLLWSTWASKHIHDVIENILFIMNSVLWGVAIEYLYSKYRSQYSKT